MIFGAERPKTCWKTWGILFRPHLTELGSQSVSETPVVADGSGTGGVVGSKADGEIKRVVGSSIEGCGGFVMIGLNP